jgi:3,4-dihydroxy-2-butanone 4-phosphate synthase
MATGKFNCDLAGLYNAYFLKKDSQIRRNRVSLTTTDSGKAKVYQSEFSVQRKYPESSTNLSEKERQKYFKRIVKSKTYQSLVFGNTGMHNPGIRFMKASANARVAGQASYSGIALRPNSGTNKYVIIHELAHTAGNMHHDVGFRQTLVKLVSRFLGTAMAKDLKKEFRSRKLKMSVGQNIMSPLKWLESYKKMEAMRDKNHLIKEMRSTV